MQVKDLPEGERKALYAAYKKFCTDFQQHADQLITHGAERTLGAPDPLEFAFSVDSAVHQDGYHLAMAKAGNELAETFAHADKRTLTSVAWPALDLLDVIEGRVVLRIPLTGPSS